MSATSTILPIYIRPGNLQTSSAIEAWVHRKLAGAFRRYGSTMTAVEVHFEDVNGPKHGAADARCVMEARVNGRLPIAVQARARDLYAAIDAASRKLDAAIARVVERTDTRARRKFRQEREENGTVAPINGIGAGGPKAGASGYEEGAAPDNAHRRGVIIAGFGPVGRALADELKKHGVPITVVDTNAETIRRQDGLGVAVLCGDITDPAVLHRAGIETAAALAVTIPDGTEAVRACAAARALSPDVYIAARTTFLSQGLEAMRAGADSITVEEIATASALAHVVTQQLTGKRHRPAPEALMTPQGPV
ncbi:MAG: NAD-binding protein [Phycisphaerales bacterium]|jgi:ribosomal subunit interface protein|nr:NAD-binding protein [Phycisphaerales bacterium]